MKRKMVYEEKEYVVLNNIEEMYKHYLKVRKQTIERKKNDESALVRSWPVKDGFMLQFLSYPREDVDNTELDNEWEEASKKPLSFEDFKTALIYHMIICQEGALEYLDPNNLSYQKYLVEDMIDENFG